MRRIRPDHFYIFSNSGGCPQNQLDGGRIVSYLAQNGYTYSRKAGNCGIIIINSCAYNSLKENQSFQKTIEYDEPGRTILLTGCMPKIAPDITSGLPKRVKVIAGCEPEKIEDIFPPKKSSWNEIKINHIPEILFRYVKKFRRILFLLISLIRKNLPLRVVHHLDRLLMYEHTPGSFIVEISKGCAGNCAYCAIRLSRGKLKSKPAREILEEIHSGIKKGVREIMLTATETSAYGLDIGSSLASLLKSIVKLLTNQKLIIFYANPRWLISDWQNLKPVFESGKIHFIHLSLNGGSNNVLKGMKRGYTLEEFEDLINSIKELSPRTILQTQVITGFPGETEEDFKITTDFFKRIYFHNVQVHAFDPRPGTEAFKMSGRIAAKVAQKRRRRLYLLTLRRKIIYDLKYLTGSAAV